MGSTLRGLKGALVLALAASLAACGSERTRARWDTHAIIDAQIGHLTDPDFTVRRGAARALGRIGPAALSAVPALICALSDLDASVREAAWTAIDRIDPSAQPEGRMP